LKAVWFQLESAWFQPSKFKCDILVSQVCFHTFDLYRYEEEDKRRRASEEQMEENLLEMKRAAARREEAARDEARDAVVKIKKEAAEVGSFTLLSCHQSVSLAAGLAPLPGVRLVLQGPHWLSSIEPCLDAQQ
jgi:hypothetical protein